MSHPVPRQIGERERFVAFAFAAADLLVELDQAGRVSFAAGAFRARLGRAPEEMVGADPSQILAPEDRAAFAAALALLPHRGRLPPTSFRLADAARTPFAVSGLHLPQPGDAARICLALSPIPAPPEIRLADGAALIREAAARLHAAGDGPTTIGLLELPAAADEAVARRIDGEISRTVPGGTMAAQMAPGRYGLMTGPGGALPDLGELARRLEAVLEQEGQPARVQTSEVAVDGTGLTPAQAARALRHGLSAFARHGAEGLREAGFGDGLRGVVAQVTDRAALLRRAVAERRFRLDYQPIVDLATREVHHREALLRLDERFLGSREGPQDFVALAETIGLTEELDLAVATLAIAGTLAAPPGERIAFNISGLSAHSPEFRRRLLAMIDRDRGAASRVMVELTESAEIEDEGEAVETLAQLRARGVPVCIDDFGAGAAAFRYLKVLPTDYVKVDGAFVVAAVRSERDRSFVAAMVDLSLAVDAKVVAERIETEEAAGVMRSLGVHYGQGWLFGKPGPLPKLAPKPLPRRAEPKEQWG
ncbi:EAL domain-containing protein [Falsiroseomonas sp. CW058]|uniref:EAL domain-containing protein n=1 Tax=Falsiroseomonas sp. CW058 TaxID=3388664 RepID=UPI003D31289E